MVDVLVDTKGQEVVLVRASLSFDPELVEIKNVERNEDLFCDWPANEQVMNNEQGIVVVTGFCQSGGIEPLYATVGEADVFARLEFVALNDGDLRLEWEYSGFDEPMKSVIMIDGSPPQNILSFDEEELFYDYIITDLEEPKMPDTNIPALENISSTFILGSSVFLLAFLANVLLDPKRRYFKKSRTVVVYDDDGK